MQYRVRHRPSGQEQTLTQQDKKKLVEIGTWGSFEVLEVITETEGVDAAPVLTKAKTKARKRTSK